MRTGTLTTRNSQSIRAMFGAAPAVTIPHRNYYGRRRDGDRIIPASGATWGQLTGPDKDSARCVVRRDGGKVQVGDAPPFVVTGSIGFDNRKGHIATYQGGTLVRRGSVLIPPGKFLATNGVDSGDFISISTAAVAPLVETLVVIPGAGSNYYTEDGILHTVPAEALTDIVLVPQWVPVIKRATPTAQIGTVVVPLTATIQSIPSPITPTVYEVQGYLVSISNGYMGVVQ